MNSTAPFCSTGERHEADAMTPMAIDGRRVLTCPWCDWQFHYETLSWTKVLTVGAKRPS